MRTRDSSLPPFLSRNRSLTESVSFGFMALFTHTLIICSFLLNLLSCNFQQFSPSSWQLNILCFFAQNKDFLLDQSYMLPAYEIAMGEIHQQYNINTSLSIITAPFLKSCDDLKSNWYLVAEYYYRSYLPQQTAWQVPVLFLNGCDEGVEIAKLIREWDMLMITTTVTPSPQPGQPPEFYSTLVSFATFQTTASVQSVLTIMAHFNWTTVYMVHDTWLKNAFYAMWPVIASGTVKDGFRRTLNPQFNIVHVGCNSSQPIPYEELLRSAMNVSRVIMIMFRGEEMRNFMIAADKLGMLNGEYIFLTAEPFDNERWFGRISWFRNDSSDTVAKHALRYVMKFTGTLKQCGSRNEEDALASEIKEQGISKYGAWYTADEKPSPAPLAAYLAVKALGRTVAESSDNSWTYSATTFAEQFRSRRFSSRGIDATIDPRGVRVPITYLEDFNIDIDSFETALIYEWNPKNSNPVTTMPNYTIDWATSDNLPPSNVPLCGYRGDSGPCAPSLTRTLRIPLLVASVLIAVSFCAALAWYLRRKNIEGAGRWWILDEQHISQITETNSFAFKTDRRISICHPTATKFHVNISPDYLYKSTPVVIKKLPVRLKVLLNRSEEDRLEKLGIMDRSNLVRLYGFVFHPQELWCVYEFLAKGRLIDLVEHSHMDWDFCMLLAYDLVNGVRTIHRSIFKCHGYITPYVCMISKHLTLKVTEGGLSTITCRHVAAETQELSTIEADLSKWFAPELRRHVQQCNDVMDMAKYATCEADVYSVASVVLWLFESGRSCRSFSQDDSGRTEILQKSLSDVPTVRAGIDVLWKFFRRRLGSSGSFIENMIRKMDNYARKLEDVVKERTIHLQEEQQLIGELLSEMLPTSILQRLLNGQSVVPELYPSVTVAFSVFDGFASFVIENTPLHVVEFLGDAFSLFDQQSLGYDVYKVETVSDCYMVVSGLPIPNGICHAAEVAALAVCLRNVFMHNFRKTGLQIMVGIHSGECAAGLVGTQRPRYCLFGDTVNVASRLASHSTGFNIQTTLETVQLLPCPTRILITERGVTYLKGTANRRTFWLDFLDNS